MWVSCNNPLPAGRAARAGRRALPGSASRGRISGAGFLLLEALVATTLLAVGVTACLRAIFNSLQASRETQMYTQGLFLAQKVMSFSENQIAFKDRWDIPGGWQFFEEAENYQYRVTVSRIDDFWTNRIIVNVRWASNPDDVDNDERNFYYRVVTEVPRSRYPEDYRK